MTNAFALLGHTSLDAILAIDGGRAVSVAEFLSNATALAARLPAHRHIVNLCENRYHFAVGFAAALLRKQITLLPPSDNAAVLEQLAADFPDLYCLRDGGFSARAMPSMFYPEDLPGCADSTAPPSFPAPQKALVLFTSGSTGVPKPHLKSWGTLVRSARAAGTRLGAALFLEATVIGTVPHQHSYGIESAVLLPLQHGLAIHAGRPFYPADVCRSLEAVPRPRILITTPIHLRALVAETGKLPNLDLVISATAPLSQRLAAEAETRFHAPLLEIYGCSEAGQLAVRRTTETDEWHCLDGVALRQDDKGTWASSAAGDGPVEVKTLLSDIIELRGAGRFLLHGRVADLVNIAGRRTSLSHLNYHLNAIDGVHDGVFVMPAEEGNRTTRLIAFAVAPGLTADAILAALRQRIEPAFLPRPLLLVDALPRNLAGKLPRDVLLRLAVPSSESHAVSGAVEKYFPVDHPTAAGHFPGNPIIPGAVLLDEVITAIAGHSGGHAGHYEIRAAKFVRPVRPGDRVSIRWMVRDGPEIRFEVRTSASGELTLVGTFVTPSVRS